MKATALGYFSGRYRQGDYSVSVGAYSGYADQPPNSIVINASGNMFSGSNPSFFYVNPIRSDTTNTGLLFYNSTTKEITNDAYPVYSSSNFPANVPIFVGNFNWDGSSTCYNAVSNTKGGSGSTNVVNLSKTTGTYTLIFPNFTLVQPCVNITCQTTNITPSWTNGGNSITATFRNTAGTLTDAYFSICIYKII